MAGNDATEYYVEEEEVTLLHFSAADSDASSANHARVQRTYNQLYTPYGSMLAYSASQNSALTVICPVNAIACTLSRLSVPATPFALVWT